MEVLEILELTMGGRSMGGEDAVRFFEHLPGQLDEKIKSDDFCSKYEYALNRLRYEVKKHVPIAPKEDKGGFTTYTCGECGSVVRLDTNKYCSNCGRKIDWSVFRGGDL